MEGRRTAESYEGFLDRFDRRVLTGAGGESKNDGVDRRAGGHSVNVGLCATGSHAGHIQFAFGNRDVLLPSTCKQPIEFGLARGILGLLAGHGLFPLDAFICTHNPLVANAFNEAEFGTGVCELGLCFGHRRPRDGNVLGTWKRKEPLELGF